MSSNHPLPHRAPAAVTLLLAFIAALGACSNDDGHSHGSGDRCSGSDPANVLVPARPGTDPEKRFTDEACRAFLDAEAAGQVSTEDSGRTPQLTAPADGAVLPRTNPPTFTWQKGAAARRSPLLRALDWLVPSAYAHGDTTGDAYVLVFESGDREVLRVMTQESGWTADDASFRLLRDAGGELRARVLWGKFVQNTLTSAVASKAVRFSFAP
jgi:hypothetical protein